MNLLAEFGLDFTDEVVEMEATPETPELQGILDLLVQQLENGQTVLIPKRQRRNTIETLKFFYNDGERTVKFKRNNGEVYAKLFDNTDGWISAQELGPCRFNGKAYGEPLLNCIKAEELGLPAVAMLAVFHAPLGDADDSKKLQAAAA